VIWWASTGEKKLPTSNKNDAVRALKVFNKALPRKIPSETPDTVTNIMDHADLIASRASPEFLARIAAFKPETIRDALEGIEEHERAFKRRSKEIYGFTEDVNQEDKNNG